ncbi:MAG: hypothetical protein R3B81_15505 [bacterium]
MRRFALAALALALPQLTACSSSDPTGPAPAPEPAVRRGYGLSPVGFPADWSALGSFYAAVGAEPGGEVLWAGPWRDDRDGGSDSGTIPAAALGLQAGASTYGFTTSIVFGWRVGDTVLLNVPGNAQADWTNDDAKALYRQMVLDFCAQADPTFLFLGNEIDFYWEQDPVDFVRWATFLGETADAIHAAHPGTRVGTVFNFEHLAGVGALNGWNAPQWGALDAVDLDRLDVVGLTVYPFFSHATPAAVPATYLDPVLARLGGRAVVVNETGWPAASLGLTPVWETSTAAQVAWIERLPVVLASADVRAVHWLFRNEAVDGGAPSLEWQVFGSISTHDAAGVARPAAAAWAELGLP